MSSEQRHGRDENLRADSARPSATPDSRQNQHTRLSAPYNPSTPFVGMTGDNEALEHTSLSIEEARRAPADVEAGVDIEFGPSDVSTRPWLQMQAEDQPKEADGGSTIPPHKAIEVSSGEEDSDTSSVPSRQGWRCRHDECRFVGHSANALVAHLKECHSSPQRTVDHSIDGEKADEATASVDMDMTNVYREDVHAHLLPLHGHQSAHSSIYAQSQSKNKALETSVVETQSESAGNLHAAPHPSGTETDRGCQFRVRTNADQDQQADRRVASILLDLGQTPWKSNAVVTATTTGADLGLDGTNDRSARGTPPPTKRLKYTENPERQARTHLASAASATLTTGTRQMNRRDGSQISQRPLRQRLHEFQLAIGNMSIPCSIDSSIPLLEPDGLDGIEARLDNNIVSSYLHKVSIVTASLKQELNGITSLFHNTISIGRTLLSDIEIALQESEQLVQAREEEMHDSQSELDTVAARCDQLTHSGDRLKELVTTDPGMERLLESLITTAGAAATASAASPAAADATPRTLQQEQRRESHSKALDLITSLVSTEFVHVTALRHELDVCRIALQQARADAAAVAQDRELCSQLLADLCGAKGCLRDMGGRLGVLRDGSEECWGEGGLCGGA